jgi:hypothetical protein
MMLHFFVSLAYLYYQAHFSRGKDMGRTVIITTVILCCVAFGWGQGYYEASGQTSVFTLAAGAHSGWAAIRGKARANHEIQNAIHIAAAQSGIFLTVSSQKGAISDIAIYTMAGRLAYRQRGLHGSALRLDARFLAPGVYNTVVHVGEQTYSHRIMVSR